MVYYTTPKKANYNFITAAIYSYSYYVFFFFAEHIRKILEETEVAAHKVFQG
ncbi:hypothetical protein [Lawsonia intracellularis]|uniref:hypothetical protein n=1 Tax=Lawsonia intracellularis TaxID=29546 RepID=UPI0015D6614C|nr:hypothetical protein [Lawsonia intracellularis]